MKENHLVNKEQIEGLIEAMLFISPNPLKLSDMYSILKIPKKRINNILNEMKQNNNYRGLEIANENDVYYLKVRDKYLDYVRKFNQNRDFSRAEIQTLSYIAYKNPVNQSDIIKTRGNRAYEHIKVLLKNGFIELEPKGHTNEIKITKKFLNYFGMNSKEELQNYFELQMMKNAKNDNKEETESELPLSKYNSKENPNEMN